MTAKAALHRLLDAARDWHGALPSLRDFAPWPDDLTYVERAPNPLPVIAHLMADPGAASPASLPLRDALVGAAPYIEWRHTYTEAEVGRDFLDRYGWFELAGPYGHFTSQQCRLTAAYWGPNLNYGWHQHAPEEIYSVISGSALFKLDGEEDLRLTPEQTRLHGSNQPHAMDTGEQPVLTFVMWRGEGLGDDPRMSA